MADHQTSGWTMDGRPIDTCHVPSVTSPEEAEIYRRLHERHCARREDTAHKVCVGRMTLDRSGITLACQLCGDARRAFPQETRHG